MAPDQAAAFLGKYKAKMFESYGVVKKDWVTVPDEMLEDTKELKKYLKASLAHVETLNPK